MTPEIQAIQKKYKDKKDQQSQLAMQEEMKAVYDKYGTSPTGSCLQLIIQMPILFALYRVIMNIPAYVQPIKELYASVITSLNASQMSQFFGINTAGSKLKASQITQCIDALTGYSSRTKGAINLAKGVDANNVLSASSNTSAVDKINSLNSFFGLNLGISPSAMFKAGTVTLIVALIIPILAGIFQLLSVQLSQKINGVASTQDNPMAGSMKAMNIMMPLFSVYMCWILSAGIGLYWMAGSLIMMLQQVIINLLSNADKFTKRGKITLDFSVNEEKQMAIFSVTDTGCGIPKEKQGLVFERFEKLNEYAQGTGLGLSICKLIVHKWKGSIWIDPDYTGGARFVFSHPLNIEKE